LTEAIRPSDRADAGLLPEPGASEPGVVDREELFKAVEELVVAVDVTTAAGSQLPGPLAGALERPAGRLVEVWVGPSGDGPGAGLVEAPRAVVAAAHPHAAIWPPALTAAVAAVEAAAFAT